MSVEHVLRQSLPLGEPSFEALRKANSLYVDKTSQFLELITKPEYKYTFLSRPRRFGKSLMISTLEAMFQGKLELFKGLAAEEWVSTQSQHPAPVLHFDMSSGNKETPENLRISLEDYVNSLADEFKISLKNRLLETRFHELLRKLQGKFGSVVVLVDEYDAPIIDNIDEPKTVEGIRKVLHSFYSVLKSSSQYLKFVMLTGVTKFSKLSIFSAMNNLFDLSMDTTWGTLLGWTQKELEANFTPWLDNLAQVQGITRSEVLWKLKEYYDGYCFDGEHYVYNPLSVMMCLKAQKMGDYWYKTATPSYLVKSLKKFGMDKIVRYEGIIVDEDFTSASEIEYATPESFLYQAGYLTIKKREGSSLTLDYPNWEIRQAIDKTYLAQIYSIKNFKSISDRLWQVINTGDVKSIEKLFNEVLVAIDYESLGKTGSFEALYHELFKMFMEVAGVIAPGEVQNAKGRADFVVIVDKFVYIIEFKVAQNSSNVSNQEQEAENQIYDRQYATQFCGKGKAVISVVAVIDVSEKQCIMREVDRYSVC